MWEKRNSGTVLCWNSETAEQWSIGEGKHKNSAKADCWKRGTAEQWNVVMFEYRSSGMNRILVKIAYRRRMMNKSEKEVKGNIEELTPKKQEYAKGAIWTDGEVLNEKVIKEFHIEEELKSRGVSTISNKGNINIESNKMISRVMSLEEKEEFSIRKSFSIRESTAQMLNELKFLHPNVNIRLNVLIDNAIRHYHEYIIDRGGFE